MEDGDMLKFKKVPEYPNFSLYVMEAGVLKIFGRFSKRMMFSTEQGAKEYLAKKRYLASQNGKENKLAKTPVLLVRYDAPYNSTMVDIL